MQLLSFAMKHHQAGNLPEAEKLYRQILQAEPGHADSLHLLGVIAHQIGKNELAVDYIGQALRFHPHFFAAYNTMGIALKAQGRLGEAIANYQQALRLKPDYAEAHYNLGNALRAQGKLGEAAAYYRQALHLKPDYVEAYNNLGLILYDQGKLGEAVANYQQALRLNPNNAEAHINLGNAQRDQGMLEEAIANCRQALRLKPDYAEAYLSLGNVLEAQKKLEEAVAAYRQAVRLKPNCADAHNNLGVALTELGRMDEALASTRETLRLEPKHEGALWQLVRLLDGKLPEPDRVLLEKRLADPDVKDAERVNLLFGMAKVCDTRREYEKAAPLLRQANALMVTLRSQKGQGRDLEDNPRFTDHLIAAFTPAFFERTRGFGLQTERPVFIVGLPRSGTTLTEQILAAHSKVFGAGELALARDDFKALGTPTEQSIFTALPGLRRETVRRLAQRHLDQLSVLNRPARRVVDKMPDNYLFLGLLATLFPKAKFIHCRRDLRDVAVSCWMTNFAHLRWTNDPEHIAVRFREYERLMEHWRVVLPVSVLDVHYEETVADLPGTARRLVEWCGLDWEPACLNFHKGTRSVRTASAVQVRQPVYTHSVARWRHYEREMSDLFTALTPLLERDHGVREQPCPFGLAATLEESRERQS